MNRQIATGRKERNAVHTVTNTEGEMLLAPSSAHSVQITGAHTTSLDLNIDVMVSKGLWGELILMELSPLRRILDLKAHKLFWGAHSGFGVSQSSGRGLDSGSKEEINQSMDVEEIK